MDVLHLCTGNLFGGVETFLTTLARRRDLWGEARHRFALCFEGRLSRELSSHGIEPDWLGAVRVSRPWTVLKARRRLAALLRRSPGFDVAICHSPWPHAIFAPVVRRAGLPLVF